MATRTIKSIFWDGGGLAIQFGKEEGNWNGTSDCSKVGQERGTIDECKACGVGTANGTDEKDGIKISDSNEV